MTDSDEKVTAKDMLAALASGLLHGTGQLIGGVAVIAVVFYFFPGFREGVIGFVQALFG